VADRDAGKRRKGAKMDLIDELEVKLSRLRDEMDQVKRQIDAERLVIIKAEFGVGIGNMVKSKNRNYRITTIRFTRRGQKPWLSGMWVKKDGRNGGTYPNNLYDDWTVISKEE
jgi:predicted GTPase